MPIISANFIDKNWQIASLMLIERCCKKLTWNSVYFYPFHVSHEKIADFYLRISFDLNRLALIMFKQFNHPYGVNPLTVLFFILDADLRLGTCLNLPRDLEFNNFIRISSKFEGLRIIGDFLLNFIIHNAVQLILKSIMEDKGPSIFRSEFYL